MDRRKGDDPASRPDEDSPEWTVEDFRNARPASEALPQFIGQAATEEVINRGRGRPRKPDRKVNQTLRLDAVVLAAYRELGQG